MTFILRRTLVVAVAVFLIAISAIGIVRATSSAEAARNVPAPLAALPASVAPAAGDPAVDDGITAELDAILAADQSTAPPKAGKGAIAGGRLRRLAAWQHLVHATVVVDLRKGGLTTVQLDHGTIASVGATTVTIAETGGSSVTVALGDETRVRRIGAKAAIADLKAGDGVFVLSKVEAGGTTAYLVVVPRK
jgi:hypothetical protein